MQQQESNIVNHESLIIDIRKLAALDIVFHGAKIIIAEFVLTVALGGALAALSLSFFFRTANHPLFAVMLGFACSWIALNYVPLLFYAILIVKQQSAQEEVAFELAHKDRYARKYTLQSFLLVVPLAVPVLALYQEWQRRSGQ